MMHWFKPLKTWWKNYSVSIRFSILSIFISLFTLGTLIVIGSNYYRLTNNMRTTSIKLMDTISSSVYREIVNNEMRSAEFVSESIAELIKQNILITSNSDELEKFIFSLLKSETQAVIQLISYADENGNTYEAEKMEDGSILNQTQIIQNHKNTLTNKYRSLTGEVIRITQLPTDYDPRKRPWYINAVEKKHSTWTDIFTYQNASSGIRGTGFSTPIYVDNKLQGVLFVGIRLDDLSDLLDSLSVSEHGVIFVVTENGALLAISNIANKPDVVHKMFSINSLKIPGVTNAFQYYLKHRKPEFIIKENGKNYVATFKSLPLDLPGKWLIGVIAPETDFIGDIRIRNIMTIIFGFFVLFIAIIIVSKLINWIVHPLADIVKETEKIKRFHLEDRPLKKSKIKEISSISRSINSMKLGLRSFQKYIPASLVRQLIERGEDAKIGGTKKNLAIFFSDIKDFTTISETMEPNELTQQLCYYFDNLSQMIDLNGGTLDKFIGDSIMAFWGAPLEEAYPCDKAALAALACIKISNELNEIWAKENKPIFFTRIGIHYGEAIVGNMGALAHLNYTAISDAINMASRLEGINKFYGSQIIISHAFYQKIKDKFIVRLLDYIVPKGKVTPNYIYELLGENDIDIPYDIKAYDTAFKMAFEKYQHQSWDEAIQLFRECLYIYPHDNLADIFIERCEGFKENPPKQPWNGAWVMSEK